MKPMYRILLVDDEENVRLMLNTAFTLSGHHTLCARNGVEALQLFRDSQPDVVLMDIRMPEVNGLEALQQMHAINPKIPVVLMTAYAAVETAVEALRKGAFDYVIKPFDLEELNMVIIALAADMTLVEADEIVPVGAIAPDHVVTPGAVIDHIISQEA